ncbi:hypothetical protein DXG01_006654, partial [Tephrocybe rancida]
MALDFLSIPDVEHAFSHGGLMVLKMRHLLLDESMCAATVLGSWTNFPDLVLHDRIVEVFNNKNKHEGKGKEKEAAIEISDVD